MIVKNHGFQVSVEDIFLLLTLWHIVAKLLLRFYHRTAGEETSCWRGH
jgi:cytochrome b